MTIIGVVVRRRVDDLDAAVGFYERLTGQSAHRFAFADAQLASVGPFLLFSASPQIADRLANVIASIRVDDVDGQAAELERLGAEILAPSQPTPNGHRFVARHPDGGVFEYVGP